MEYNLKKNLCSKTFFNHIRNLKPPLKYATVYMGVHICVWLPPYLPPSAGICVSVWVCKDMPIYCTHECIRVPESFGSVSLSLPIVLSLSGALPSTVYRLFPWPECWAKVFVFIWRLRLLHVWQKLLNPCGFLEQQVHSVTISLNPGSNSFSLVLLLSASSFVFPFKEIVIGICCYLSKLAKSFICSF